MKSKKRFIEGDFGDGSFYVMDKKLFSKGEAFKKGINFFRDKGSDAELKIYAGYVRYLPKTPAEDVHDYGEGGLYRIIDTAQKGAFEVWIVEEV